MWIKLCGFRDVPTALAAAEAGADAVGLNFYAPSPRSIEPAAAREIVAALPPRVMPVGLFVNHPLDETLRVLDACPLPTVQLHGDETAEHMAALLRERPALRLIRAFRFAGDLQPLRRELAELAERGVAPTAILVDAHVTGTYGGTGHTVPWSQLAESWDEEDFPPLILAGGLTPENVSDAVLTVQPWGVDTAGGVESERAVKDLERIRAFVAAARAAG